MNEVIIYHNPRCSKSRQALELLLEKGFEPEIIEYLKSPLSKSQIKQLLQTLGKKPREILRKNEPIYKELSLSSEHLTDDGLIAIMQEYPILIERPIVLIKHKAIVARPAELILELLK